MTQPHYIDRACQKCGGEIQGWTCQGCGQVFRENDAGALVFDDDDAPPALAVIPTQGVGQSSGNTGELNTERKTNDSP